MGGMIKETRKNRKKWIDGKIHRQTDTQTDRQEERKRDKRR